MTECFSNRDQVVQDSVDIGRAGTYHRPMADCCHTDYRKVFRTGEGFRDIKRYEKRGLRGSEATIAGFVRDLDIPGASLIEVGAGAGALHVDLLGSGASSATAVDISAGWNESAAALLTRTNRTDRVTRVVGDFVEQADAIPSADIVLLHRVICCYPHWTKLVDAAAGHAQRAIVFTIPRPNLLARLTLMVFNLWLRAQGCGFKAFIHPIPEILERFADQGFAVTGREASLAWVTYRVESV